MKNKVHVLLPNTGSFLKLKSSDIRIDEYDRNFSEYFSRE